MNLISPKVSFASSHPLIVSLSSSHSLSPPHPPPWFGHRGFSAVLSTETKLYYSSRWGARGSSATEIKLVVFVLCFFFFSFLFGTCSQVGTSALGRTLFPSTLQPLQVDHNRFRWWRSESEYFIKQSQTPPSPVCNYNLITNAKKVLLLPQIGASSVNGCVFVCLSCNELEACRGCTLPRDSWDPQCRSKRVQKMDGRSREKATGCNEAGRWSNMDRLSMRDETNQWYWKVPLMGWCGGETRE